MKATKILIVLAATAAISLAVIGVAYGQYSANQTYVNPNSLSTTENDFWGWLGGCLGFGPRQPYDYHYQYQYPNNTTTQPDYVPPQQPYQPYQPQYPDQGYSYGYRRGCWGW